MAQAMVAQLAAELDVPLELLPTAEQAELSAQERARLDAEHEAEVRRVLDDAARDIGPRVMESLGLDPERYELRFAYDDEKVEEGR